MRSARGWLALSPTAILPGRRGASAHLSAQTRQPAGRPGQVPLAVDTTSRGSEDRFPPPPRSPRPHRCSQASSRLCEVPTARHREAPGHTDARLDALPPRKVLTAVIAQQPPATPMLDSTPCRRGRCSPQPSPSSPRPHRCSTRGLAAAVVGRTASLPVTFRRNLRVGTLRGEPRVPDQGANVVMGATWIPSGRQ